jgi:hypothetical protein
VLSTGPDLVPIQSSIQWVPRFLSTVLKQPRGEAGHSFPVPRLSMRGSVSLLPQTSSWRGVNFVAEQRDTYCIVTWQLKVGIVELKEAALRM